MKNDKFDNLQQKATEQDQLNTNLKSYLETEFNS